MLNRRKLFLTFLGPCLVPLLLLALANYWNGVRIAEATLRAEQEARLADFKSQVNTVVSKDRNALIELSKSRAMLDYFHPGSQAAVRQVLARSNGAVADQGLSSANPTGDPLTDELRVRVAFALSDRSHFASISLFDWNKQPRFVVELRDTDRDLPIVFQIRDFLSQQPQPDQRLWMTPAETRLSSSATSAPLGGHMVFTVAVTVEKPEGATPQGALVGDLKLDQIFSDAAHLTPSSGSGTRGVHERCVFIVLDRAGKILYDENEALKHQSVSESMPYFAAVGNHMMASEQGRQSFTKPDGYEYSALYEQIPALDASVAVASNHDEALAEARLMGRLSVLSAVLIGLVTAFGLTFYWQRRSRGIERVSAGVAEIAKGKLDHRIELLSSDDLRPMADNLGLMTKQLRDQIAREAETQQFQSFVRLSAILTHDLKNAIEALSLTVTNMERLFDNQEFRADAMKTLRSATENLRALVTRLSNPVSTLSGEHKRPSPVDLVPILKRVISMLAEPAGGQHEIGVNLPESLFALVDAERIDKVAENLIINGLEAMSTMNGKLTIEAGQTEDGKPFFSVADTGEGMSRHFIEERLFHPFATTKKRGVGLGLYTCREVVRANGGSIEVDSEEGAGTTFRVVLPSGALN